MKTIFLAILLAIPAWGLCDCGYEPMSIEWVDGYKDGGTIGAAVVDSSGCLVEFCFDYRLDSTALGRMYVGARHPGREPARMATEAEEQAVLKLAWDILDLRYSKVEQQQIMDAGLNGGEARQTRSAYILLRELNKDERRLDRDVAYAAPGRQVEGHLLFKRGDLHWLAPCPGGSKANAVYLVGSECIPRGQANPYTAPVIFVVVQKTSDFGLSVVALPDSVVEHYEFRSVAPGTYPFLIERPMSGIGDGAVRLYLDGEFAGEAGAHLVMLGGFK